MDEGISDGESFLQRVFARSPHGILSIDRQGFIRGANPAIETMCGYGPGDLNAQSVESRLPGLLQEVRQLHRETGVIGLCLLAVRKDGTTFPVEVTTSEVSGSDGPETLAFVVEVVERDRVAAALEWSHRNLAQQNVELERRTAQLRKLAADLTVAEQHAREELAKTLHDHLQQFLFSSKLQLTRLEQSLPASADSAMLFARVRQDLDEAIAAARSLSVELFPPVLHSQGLPSALAWLADRMRSKYDFEVGLSIDPKADVEPRHVRILVFESVRELLFNVVKHAKVNRAHLDIQVTKAGQIAITISDEGIGFDPARALLGDSHTHTGLGLFSIRERLTLLGGQLEVDSAPGRGAHIRLLVPMSDTSAAQDSRTAPASPLAAGWSQANAPVRVLLVDDHAAVREGLRELLRAQPGLDVVGEAANGVEAIAQTRALLPDVIVIDVSMPEMDGIEATRRIHQEYPDIHIFGLSTHENPDDLHAIQRVGAVGYFTKGADTTRLVDRILQVKRP